jgi:uncharacterized integral membrane protein
VHVTSNSGNRRQVSPRLLAAVAISVLLVLFIVMNRRQTRISFIVFDADAALWVALAIAALAGFGAGFLVGRKRYR